MRRLLPIACLATLSSLAAADLRLGPLFTDHAVLQKDAPVPVWGWADPGEFIEVSIGPALVSTKAGADGRWRVDLPAMPVNSQPQVLSVVGKGRKLALNDILVGDVWFCAGQSNMEFDLRGANRGAEEVAAAKYPLIRHVKIERKEAQEPQSSATTAGGWKPATPETAGDFTAVGYFFAREIVTRIDTPIGLVNCTWGGSAIEPWLAREWYQRNPTIAPLLPRWDANAGDRAEKHRVFDEAMAKWTAAEAQATKAGQPFTLPKPELWWELRYPLQPCTIHNGMVNPLFPAVVRGFLWYQGEGNAARAGEYGPILKELVSSWRGAFGAPDAAFYVVQLANWDGDNPTGTNWAVLRDQQASVLSLPNTGLAVAVDIGDKKDIHPKNKQEVGRRLALIARAQVYGQSVDYLGPTFAGAVREGAAMRVSFKNTAGALTAREKPLTGFAIAGADRVFYPADAVIRRDTVLVSSPKVPEPVAVRYAWINSPDANLYNGAGLPAVPFRTDEW